MVNRRVRWTGAAALIMVLATAQACGTSTSHVDALATVNGQALTASAWKLAVNATDLIQHVNMSTSKSAEKQQVKSLASEWAVEQYALKHHWVTPSKAGSEAQLYLHQNVINGLGGTGQADALLKQKHLTQAGLMQFLTQQMELQAAYAHAIKGTQAPSAKAVQAYYNTHKSMFTSPAQDEMRMILVKTKSLAESLMAKLQHGASWHTLALKYSLDTYSKKKGGEYGWVNTGPQSNFVTPFYVEMDKLKPGQYGIAHTQYGYHVIEVQKSRPGQLQSFAAVKQAISNGLLQQQEGKVFQVFSQKVVKASKIKITV